MLNKNKTQKIIYLFSILLVSLIAHAEEVPQLPLIEEKKTKDEVMWDKADEVFKNAPAPTMVPDKSIAEGKKTLEQQTSQDLPKFIGNEDKPSDNNKPNEISDTKTENKLPIGRTNTLTNGNFKKKATPDYAKFNLIGPNKNLPPVYFESNLVGDAFDAVKKGDVNTLRYLIKNYDLENFVDESGANLLIKAAEEGQRNVLRMLLVNQYDINFLNAQKMSALHVAVTNQDIKMVKTLLTMKIDASLKDSQGKTALDYAQEINSEIKDFIVSYLK